MQRRHENDSFFTGVGLVASIGLFALAIRSVNAPASQQEDVTAIVADCRNASPEHRKIEKDVRAYANQQRQKLGVPGLQWSDALADAARHHSCRMMALNFFDHIDPELGELSQRLRVAGLDTSNIGENVFKAKGGDPAKRAVDLWMKSPHHRENLLDPGYRWTGVGFAVAADGTYWFTHDFSGANPLLHPSPNRAPNKGGAGCSLNQGSKLASVTFSIANLMNATTSSCRVITSPYPHLSASSIKSFHLGYVVFAHWPATFLEPTSLPIAVCKMRQRFKTRYD